MGVVKIVESPRDAWQGLPGRMPPEVKADYLRVLIAAGFRNIDAVSFATHSSSSQASDSEAILRFLDPPTFDPDANDGVEIIGLVTNAKGAERAVKTEAIQTLGFPYSLSPTYLDRNQKQTPEDALDALEAIGTVGYKAGLDVVAYISMAFGNPYGDAWDIEEVVAACDLLADNGVRQISLHDTVGTASPRLIGGVVEAVLAVSEGVEIGVHLHARPADMTAKVRAAYEAGCRRFDSAMGGMGGAPLAEDVLVSNVGTEALIAELTRLGAEIPALRPLDGLRSASADIARKFGTATVH